MACKISSLHHIQITVPNDLEYESKDFYQNVLGLSEIPKPKNLKKNGGAWYQVGNLQLHLSLESAGPETGQSKRHICYLVDNIEEAETRFHALGVEIIEDKQPTPGWRRFYLRDPGGNRIEITQPD